MSARQPLTEEDCLAWRKEREGFQECDYQPPGRANWDKSRLFEAYGGSCSWRQAEDGMWHVDFDAHGGVEYWADWLRTINQTSVYLGVPSPWVELAFTRDHLAEGLFLDSSLIDIYIPPFDDDDAVELFINCLTHGWASAHDERLVS